MFKIYCINNDYCKLTIIFFKYNIINLECKTVNKLIKSFMETGIEINLIWIQNLTRNKKAQHYPFGSTTLI